MSVDEKSIWVRTTLNEQTRKFPFNCTEAGEFFAYKDFFTERDYKDSYWLVYTLAGEGILEQNGVKIFLRKGDFALIDCRKPQKYYSNTPVWHHYWVHINGSGVDSLFNLINSSGICKISTKNEELKEFYEEILKNVKQRNTKESLQINLNLNNILTSLAQTQLTGEVEESSRSEDMQKAAKYLRDHYKENIIIEDLSQKFHLSKYYFIRMFKQFMGTTPYDYLLHYRITKSKELLCTTQWSTGRIGLYVGFGSESNFTSQFKKIVKINPSKYRKENYNIN